MADKFFEKVGSDVKRVNSDRSGGGGAGGVSPVKVRFTAVDVDPAAAPKPSGEQRWASNNDAFWGAASTYEEIPAGCYRVSETPGVGIVMLKQTVETDNLLELPDSSSAEILSEFDNFWTLKESFTSRGFLHKRGYLLWGPPGSGKSSTLQLMIKKLIEDQDGVVILIDNPILTGGAFQLLRQIEPTRPLIAILEDIDALIERYGETQFLALLDGESQINNLVFIATTNYPERLDKRFVDRPSRFDTIKYVGMPTADARRVYLQAKEPSLEGEELETWVDGTEGLSVAHLKEVIIAVRCFKQPLEAVLKRMEEMRVRPPKSEDAPDKPSFGMLGAVKNGHGIAGQRLA
jgi:energy-coupling factor transporter ATP-binding protein EcfA2